VKALIYYHDDMDGKCSAAIVLNALVEKCEVELRPLMYDNGVKLPDNLHEFWRVYILDYTLPKELMDDLCTSFRRENVIWIDHHISQLKLFADKYEHFEGVRQDGIAASALTWKFMYGERSMPEFVKHISDRDLWKIDSEDTMCFYEWLTSVENHPGAGIWDYLLRGGEINSFIRRGKVLRTYRLRQMRRDIESVGYEGKIDGHRCLVANYSSYESISDAGHYICEELNYPVALIYYIKKNKDGKRVMIFNLRSQKDVDVSEIAAKRGGGGHKQAAGYFVYV